MSELKAYQVGDNDFVIAYNTDQAKKIMVNYYGKEALEMDAFQVPLTDRVQNEDETESTETIGDMLVGKVAPQYLFGWE